MGPEATKRPHVETACPAPSVVVSQRVSPGYRKRGAHVYGRWEARALKASSRLRGQWCVSVGLALR